MKSAAGCCQYMCSVQREIGDISIAYLHGVFVKSKDLNRRQGDMGRAREREEEWGQMKWSPPVTFM